MVFGNLCRILNEIRVICNTSYIGKRLASTYEGDGKTHAQVLNKESDILMVDAVSESGFRLNAGFRIIGPCILFPKSFLSWNIQGVNEISSRSLSLFSIIYPKLDLLVLGYGGPEPIPKQVQVAVREFSANLGISIECSPTERAIATYNFLVHEKRYVAGAFIPPTKVKLYSEEDFLAQRAREHLLENI